jgi:hypothetical protein
MAKRLTDKERDQRRQLAADERQRRQQLGELRLQLKQVRLAAAWRDAEEAVTQFEKIATTAEAKKEEGKS